ncbi:hypothetical protein [Microbispora sp. NPDC049125]|uniref:hypothetical protein n=1 Tax=Microbispora sp. NPDC049125 TaxID=3154929 RepID=UPI003465B759
MTTYAITLDVVEPRKAVGWTEPDGSSILGTREDGKWLLYTDDHQATAKDLRECVKRLAKALGLTGQAAVCWEYKSPVQHIVEL